MKLPITEHQYLAMQADSYEANNLMQLAQAKAQANKRHSDTILLDAGHDPEKFASYQLKQEPDQFFLVLAPKPEEPKPTTAKE